MSAADKERKAAKSALKKAYKKKQRRNRPLVGYISPVILMVLFIACLVSIAGDWVELSDRQEELQQLKEQAEVLEAENARYESILSEEDERAYMEKAAAELDYAYPNERRFRIQ